MKTENLQTEKRKTEDGKGTGIIKTGILEWKNKNFESRSRETDKAKIWKIKHASIEKLEKGKKNRRNSQRNTGIQWTRILE